MILLVVTTRPNKGQRELDGEDMVKDIDLNVQTPTLTLVILYTSLTMRGSPGAKGYLSY